MVSGQTTPRAVERSGRHCRRRVVLLGLRLVALGGALAEIHEQVGRAYRLHAALLFISASGALFSLLHRRIDWLAARYAALALLPLLYIATVVELRPVGPSVRTFRFGGLAFGNRDQPVDSAPP